MPEPGARLFRNEHPPDAAASHRHEQTRQCGCACKRRNDYCEREDVHNAILRCEKHGLPCATKMGASASYPSLEDCPCVPNSRWPLGSVAHTSCVALAACGRACSRLRRGGERLLAEVIDFTASKEEAPAGGLGHAWLGLQLPERIELGLFTLRRLEKCTCSLLLPHHRQADIA